jgi:hypothetical protein
MTDEIAVAQPVELEGRNAAGQFAPGWKGKPKGSLQKITRALKDQLAQELETAGIRGNPLVILLRLAMDEEVHPAVRMQSADRLAKYLAPTLMSVELQQPDDATFEAEMTRIKMTLRNVLKLPTESHED